MRVRSILNLKGILLTFLLFSVNGAYSQFCLKGRVVFSNADSKGRVSNLNTDLPPADIYANDLQVGTTIDSLGQFHICDIPKGEHVFTVSSVGFESVHFNLKTQTDTFVSIVLVQRILETAELTVTGVSRANNVKTNAQALQIIDTRVWEHNTSQGLIQVLANQPGIASISTGAAIAKPVIRGLGYNRIVTVSDGVRQEGQQWGDEHGIEVDDFGIAKVEVLKGPGSLMYGSDAIAGVINIIDPLPDRKQIMRGKVMLGYQSNNGQRTTAAVLSGGKDHWSYLVRAFSKDAHCYQNARDGFVANSGFNNSSMKAVLTTHRKWGYSQMIYSAYRMKLGIIEGERDSMGWFLTPQMINGKVVSKINTDSIYNLYELQYPQQDIFHQKLVSNTRIYWGKKNFKMVYAYQENVRKEIGTEFQRNAPDLWMRLQTGTYQLQLNGESAKQMSWSIGSSGMLQASKNYGATQLIADYHLVDAGVYGLLYGNVKSVYWQAGLRYDHRWMQWHSMQKEFGGISGSVGASYQFSKKHYLKFNVSRGYRAPNAAELTSNGVHEGALRYEIGNASLKPESSLQSDIQLMFNWSHFSLTSSLFQNNVNNFIYISRLENSNFKDSILQGLPVFQFKGQAAVLRGFELQYDYHPHPLDWLHIGQSLSYVTAHFVGATNTNQYYLPNIPPMRLLSNVQAEFPKFGRYLQDVELGVNYMYVWPQTLIYKAFQTESSTPAYALLNAQFSAKIISKRFESLNLVVSGNNLLNTVYQDHLSRLKYAPLNTANGYNGVWNMGRNIAVKLVIGI